MKSYLLILTCIFALSQPLGGCSPNATSSESPFVSDESQLRNLADTCLAVDVGSLKDKHDLMSLEGLKGNINSVLERSSRLPNVVTADETKLLNDNLKAIEARIVEVEKELKRQDEERAKAKVAEEKKKQARISALKAKTRKKYVKFDDITWYEHTSQPQYMDTRSFIAVYFLIDNNGSAQNLRIKNVFTADSWLFVESYEIKTDSQTYEIDKGSFDVKRDNDTEIWEWYDDPVDDKTMAMLRDISTSKSVIIRYNGQQYRHDRTIGAAEKKSIAEMLELYALLGG